MLSFVLCHYLNMYDGLSKPRLKKKKSHHIAFPNRSTSSNSFHSASVSPEGNKLRIIVLTGGKQR